MKSLIALALAVLISLSTHRKSSQPKDDESIVKIEIKHSFLVLPRPALRSDEEPKFM